MKRLTLLAAALMLGTAPAMAQQFKPGDTFQGPDGRPCAKDTDIMAHMLGRDYHEVVIGLGWGITPVGAGVTQFYTSKAGTWTMTLTVASGVTCIMLSGEGWNRLAVELPDPTRKAM